MSKYLLTSLLINRFKILNKRSGANKVVYNKVKMSLLQWS